jgi:hypothetical protein
MVITASQKRMRLPPAAMGRLKFQLRGQVRQHSTDIDKGLAIHSFAMNGWRLNLSPPLLSRLAFVGGIARGFWSFRQDSADFLNPS